MAFDFPNSPTIGQVFQGWIWDGEKWDSNAPSIPSPATAPPIIDGTATVGTSVRYAREDHVHPSDAAAQAVRYDAAQGLTSAQRSQARANIDLTKKNYIINGAFTIQQDLTYVSGAALAAGAYGHDQWKAGASGGDYTFTQLKSSTTITIAAGKSLIQPIEDVRVVGGGNYVLAWTGTAQARAGVNTLTPSGTYAASPLLITGQTDGTVMSVEFNAGTLGGVGLYEGTVAPPFQVPDYASELALCQRYWEGGNFRDVSYNAANGFNASWIPFKAFKRSSPTMNHVNVLSTNVTGPAPQYLTQDGFNYAWQIIAAGTGDLRETWTASARL